jgi:prepilin-type N-terminal cleavage/methylation domain-containing protein
MFKRAAFTMIELVIVIVVMGIVASIGSDIIVNLYENYIKTKAINRLQAQSELVLNQIAKKLGSRVKDSVIARNDTTFLDYVTLTDANDSYQILEWIGKDAESFNGIKNPGWSGFIDLDNPQTTNPTLKTIGSELNTTNSIIKSLSNNQVSLLQGDGLQKPAIIFKGNSIFNLDDFGWNGVDGNYTHKVSYTAGLNDVLNFEETNKPTEIFEQYDLAWSAYAIVPEGDQNDFNLTLHYNYQPWEDERYDQNASKSVLIEHASTFKFTKVGDTIRLKLCVHDNNQSGNYDFAFCKEKVVY